MSTVTALFHAGGSHNYHGGIIPKYEIHLHENSRPALLLYSISYNDEIIDKLANWIPTIDNMEEDLLLMVSAIIQEDEKVLGQLRTITGTEDISSLELYEDLSEDDRSSLYKLNRERLDTDLKLTGLVYPGSTIVKEEIDDPRALELP